MTSHVSWKGVFGCNFQGLAADHSKDTMKKVMTWCRVWVQCLKWRGIINIYEIYQSTLKWWMRTDPVLALLCLIVQRVTERPLKTMEHRCENVWKSQAFFRIRFMFWQVRRMLSWSLMAASHEKLKAQYITAFPVTFPILFRTFEITVKLNL